ncbi:MAG: division/cell wall cluster transcriptional repressor MraZ [Synergistales bacterium]|jgi:MraZ protein
MLVGTFEHRLDSKGRLVIPARFREELGNSVVASFGIDRCVSIYSQKSWEGVLERLHGLPYSKGKTRDLVRVLLASAHEIPIDPAGRILLPQSLRDQAEIDQEVSINGVLDHIEVWNSEKWDSYRARVMETLPEIAEEVDGF